ncbi:MAG: acetylglutamate kinase [Christensenellales bacterium]|jgi:acetylglutamate kinase
MLSNEIRAQVLTDALPYMQKYHGKVVVIKYGGNAMTDENLKHSVIGDIVLLRLAGVKVVLVHGGGPEIEEMLNKINHKSSFVDGLRYTDAQTADIVQMVLAGKVNKSLVAMVNQKGGKAIGLSGSDGLLIEAEIKSEKYGFVGEILNVNADYVSTLLDDGYIPIISTVTTDKNGQILNINADTAAARIAAALKATSMLLLTNTRGVLKDKNNESSLIPEITLEEIPQLIKSGVVSAGMLPKVSCCEEAIRRGVPQALIIDGRVPHSIIIEMYTNSGIGTLFKDV